MSEFAKELGEYGIKLGVPVRYSEEAGRRIWWGINAPRREVRGIPDWMKTPAF